MTSHPPRHRPPGPTFRRDLLRLWIALDGSKVLSIGRDDDGRLRATLGTGLGRSDIGVRRVANWVPRTADRETSRVPSERLDRLVVEAGWTGLGRTYELLFARPNPDPTLYDGLPWVAVEPTTPLHEIRLFPQTGASFFDAVMHQDDEGEIDWAPPFTRYRPATPEETRAHRSR